MKKSCIQPKKLFLALKDRHYIISGSLVILKKVLSSQLSYKMNTTTIQHNKDLFVILKVLHQINVFLFFLFDSHSV